MAKDSARQRANRSYVIIAAAILMAGVIIAAAILESSAISVTNTVSTTYTTTYVSNQTVIHLSTASSTSCDYVIPAPCPSGQTFTVSVNYTGSWSITYEGYNSVCYYQANSTSRCGSGTQTLDGVYDGSGTDSRQITVGGQSNGWTLCAQAQKTDNSASALVLDVAGSKNETSAPFGAAATCAISMVV